jgi:hypothetical protein
MKRALLPLLLLVACGGAPPPAPPPPPSPPVAPKAAEPPPPVEEKPVEPPAPPAPAPEAKAEECDEPWLCVSVSLKNNKVEKRTTKLLGDPKIEQTWSKNVDSARSGSFDFVQGRVIEVALRSLAGDKSQVVLRAGKGAPEVVLDTHKGADFMYVGVIAAEKDGAVLIDFRYLK